MASFKWTLYRCVISVCCVGFLLSDSCVYVYCVESIAYIESYSDCSRKGSHLVEHINNWSIFSSRD